MSRKQISSVGSASAIQPERSAAGLEPYTAVLDRRTAAHLLRRTSYFGSAQTVSALVGRSAAEVVSEIVFDNQSAPLPPAPVWANRPPPPRSAPSAVRSAYNSDNNDWVKLSREDWVRELLKASLREKTSLFWHDHFATEIRSYRYAFYAYHYLKLIRTHALKYFKPFVYGMGIEPAMLIYLNGNRNTLFKPNENYARELLELFTMSPTNPTGDPTYTEDDVKAISQALTGWVIDENTGYAVFDPTRHDTEPIAIFGQNPVTYYYENLIELIFSARGDETAHYIAEKLYSLFVYEEPDLDIVIGLASHFKNNNYSIQSTISLLLKSAHFFSDDVIGAQIKSPVELMLQLIKSTGRQLTYTEEARVERLIRFLEQELLNPPGVDGWPGHHDWISTNSLPLRWVYSDYVLSGGSSISKATLLPMADELYDRYDPHAAFFLPAAIAEHFLAVSLDMVDIPEVDEEFAGDLNTFPIPAEVLAAPPYVRNLAKIFLGSMPWYEWDLSNTGSNDRVIEFVKHIVRYPEYQLM